ncbi:MAG: ATP-dependent metalloprotease FtsH [Myxococcaceae bacterium]|nr:ATP-dependent metalloprotease FtsH [Myxococcaceae bacterium]
MTTEVAESSLPLELNAFAAVEAAYPAEISRITDSLRNGLSVLVEADKELTPYLYRCVRDRLKKEGKNFLYLDGRPISDMPPLPPGISLVGAIIFLLREAVRGAVADRLLVLPHLDLLTTSVGGLTSEAREAIPLLYENPELVFLGFKDPSFPVPRVIENLFPRSESILGTPRDRLGQLVTQREARKLSPGKIFKPYSLYKHVSGVNAVRLRRMLSTLQGEDYPADAKPAFQQLRANTLVGQLQVPDVDLKQDIGGYAKVKERLQKEILDVLNLKDGMADESQVKRVEGLIPRGMIFWGPPGTGKTLFAKAMATSLGAAVSIVSGPELKSKWVGESEENLRRVFVQARQAAPAIIIFDELDSFAVRRGMHIGSGVEHSMVNQLLTEMDGFRKDELVFVVGTTNFVESLDPALLRPGRFEFHLHIPFPGPADRRAILEIYDQKMTLGFSPRALDYTVKRTGDLVEGTNTRYTGDHLQALCRALARMRLRENRSDATTVDDVEKTLNEFVERPALTAKEEGVVATHEAGHAVAALFCPHSPPIDRISIRGDLAGSLGFVAYSDPAHRYVVTQGQLLDQICTLFGGREAEVLCFNDLSIGSSSDLDRATAIARALVEEFGMGGEAVGVRRLERRDPEDLEPSEALKGLAEAEVRRILEEQRARAGRILRDNRTLVESLRDMLVEKKVLDREALGSFLPAGLNKNPAPTEG